MSRMNFAQPRFRTLLLVVFAGIALLIAAVGVYGVMAYATVQRSSEMAIRLALGCSVDRIFMLVVTDGLRLTLIGVANRNGPRPRARTLAEVLALRSFLRRRIDARRFDRSSNSSRPRSDHHSRP